MICSLTNNGLIVAFCLAFPAYFILHLSERSVSVLGDWFAFQLCTPALLLGLCVLPNLPPPPAAATGTQLLADVLLKTFSISAAERKKYIYLLLLSLDV